ncbi:unnamed protein product, partial [Prorocentrum cordatum]
EGTPNLPFKIGEGKDNVHMRPPTTMLVELTVALLAVARANGEATRVPWQTYNGDRYVYVQSPTRTRDQAVAECTSLGAELATITSNDQNTFIGTLMPQVLGTSAWIANAVNDGLYSNFLPDRPDGSGVCIRFLSLVWTSYHDHWDDEPCSSSYGYVCIQSDWTNSPTATPTPSSTATPSPSPSPTSALPATAMPSATGDPHLQNIHGERFDLTKPGTYVLINIPRGKGADSAMLRVQADAVRLGKHCGDLYFQELNVTGRWAEAKQAGGYHYSVSQQEATSSGWVEFGKVALKIVVARTQRDVQYLNVFAKRLGQSGFAVGGLLGEDDHEEASSPPEACVKRVSLAKGAGPVVQTLPTGSIAAATLA